MIRLVMDQKKYSMQDKLFYSKILLFGEYGIIGNSSGLSIPFRKFSGKLKLDSKLNSIAESSNIEIQKFYEYLKVNISDLVNFNSKSLEEDISNGLHFDSNIPNGFGVGSSGALVAAIYYKYCSPDNNDFSELKKIFSIMESYFHGTSSGLDPLVSYLDQTLLTNSGNETSMILDNCVFNNIYLIDSGNKSNTTKMISIFSKKMENDNFKNNFKNNFIPSTNNCIENYLNCDVMSLMKNFRDLSNITFNNFNEMIPDKIKSLWQKGLESDSYYMKLCGSGGGGFFLIFDFENKLKDKLSEFKLIEI